MYTPRGIHTVANRGHQSQICDAQKRKVFVPATTASGQALLQEHNVLNGLMIVMQGLKVQTAVNSLRSKSAYSSKSKLGTNSVH